MDPFLLGSLSIILLAITFIVVKIVNLAREERKSKMLADALRADAREERREAARNQAPVVVGGRRRNVPVRRRVNQAEEDVNLMDLAGRDSDDEIEEDPLDNIDLPDGKIGKKKMAKLQAKAEKRSMRESELQEREEKKKRDAEKEAKQKSEEEKRRLEEERLEEIKQKEKEEKEQREREAYLKMKEAFSVEEEGYDEEASLDSQNLLQEFISYIKKVKVAHVDELAAHFKLRSPDVVSRIESLVTDGTLTGVIDDRGKFIYITEAELEAVARFINQRGRVSVSELVEYSNKLIKLEPECTLMSADTNSCGSGDGVAVSS